MLLSRQTGNILTSTLFPVAVIPVGQVCGFDSINNVYNGASPCYQTFKVAIVSSSFIAYDITLKDFGQQCCKSLITTFLSVTEVSSHCFPLTVWWITL